MLCFVFAILVVLLDQFFKRWILLTIALYDEVPLIPGVFGLTHWQNDGAAFSILNGQRWLLAGIAFVAVLLLIAILLRYDEGFWGTLGLAAILGGAIGNLADRLFNNGFVIDMFKLYFVDFAIFNVADIFITLGGITFVLFFIFNTIKPEKNREISSAKTPAGYTPVERTVVDEIGLYDFRYGDDTDDGDTRRYGITQEEDVDSSSNAGIEPEPLAADIVIGSNDLPSNPPEEKSATLDALSELEAELIQAEALDDYDIDALLKEYGFEDDKN